MDAGPSLALDGRLGANLGGRLGAEVDLGRRVALGAGLEPRLVGWRDVGGEGPGSGLAPRLFAAAHVGIQLGAGVRLEPGVGLGVMRYEGNVDGTLPGYGSTIAIALGALRIAIESRVAIGAASGGLAPGTELSVVVGWQG